MESTAQYRATQCPPRGLLLAFDTGDLPPAEIDTISIHLATCEVCLAFLDSRNQGLPGKSIDGKIPVLFSDEESAKSFLLDDTAFEKIRGDSGFQQMKAFAKAIRIDEDRDTAGMDPPPVPPKLNGEVLPEKIGRYFVLNKLGNGAFANVYLARDSKQDRLVAIKVPRTDRLKSSDQIEDFLREARTAATLDHPNVVRVFDFGRLSDGSCFVVMKYIEGTTLEAAMKAERFTFERIAELCIQIAEALDHAHQKGIFHRDVKPANILLDKAGHAYVADFGLAIHEDTQHLHVDEVAGTWYYMSPEQVRGEADFLDGRSDVWSLGVILYELLTRKKPFPSKDKSVLKREIQNREPKPPRSLDSRIPPELERICLLSLVKSIADRCPSARDFADDLRRGKQPAVPAVRTLESRLRTWNLRSYLLAASGVALMLVIGLGIYRTSGASRRSWEPNRWYALLDQPPKTFMESKLATDTKWYYDDKTQEVLINSSHPVALTLGEAQSDDFCVEVRIERSDWQGTAGFFWGLHDDRTEDGLPAQSCQLIVMHSFTNRGKVTHRLERAFLKTWTPPQGKTPLQDRDNYGSVEVAAPDSSKVLLELTVIARQVREVRWNGVLLPAICDRPERSPPRPLVSQGNLGLYNASGTAIFRDARIRPLPISSHAP